VKIALNCRKFSCIVKPLNKGRIGDNINSAVCLLCTEVVLFLEVQKCNKTIGKPIIWELKKWILRRELGLYVPISEGLHLLYIGLVIVVVIQCKVLNNK